MTIKSILKFIIQIYQRYKFKRISVVLGDNVCVNYPYDIFCKEGLIDIQEDVSVHKYSWWLVSPLTGYGKAKLIIGKRTRIGLYSHIVSTRSVIIGNNVEISPRVYISDNIHGYYDIEIPCRDQQIIQKKDVFIGDDSWLGENVCVIGVTIGKHCVIGANSVVTHDIPDYSVAVGAPAKVIKRYNFENNKWERVDKL